MTIGIGDKVITSVFVGKDRVDMNIGIVTGVYSGYYDVDVMSLHGGAPWIQQHPASHVRLEKPEVAR